MATFTDVELKTGILANNVLDGALADITASGKPVTLYAVTQWLGDWMQDTSLRCSDPAYIMAYLAQENFINELEVEMFCSKLIACGIVSAMETTFSPEPEIGLAIEIASHGGIVEPRFTDSYNPGLLASEPDIYGYDD